MRNRRGFTRWLGGLVALLALGALVLWWALPTTPRVPTPSDVQAMTATLDNSPQGLPDVSEFAVLPEDIPRVLEALGAAGQDDHPAKWPVLGRLICTCKRGKTVVVDLYWTGHATGAFSVAVGPRRIYFRSGTDRGIEDAVRHAQARANREKDR